MRLLLLLVLACTLAAPTRAQRNGEAYVTQARSAAGTSVPDLIGDAETASSSVVERFLADPFGFAGLGVFTNTTFIRQEGAGNEVLLEQDGQRNSAVVVEVGNGNFASLLQRGDDNQYEAVLQGDNNATLAEQRGDGNQYGLLYGGADLRHTVLQEGDGNQAFQIGFGTARPADVIQRGDGLQLLIEHR
jgi:hypothetical protein